MFFFFLLLYLKCCISNYKYNKYLKILFRGNFLSRKTLATANRYHRFYYIYESIHLSDFFFLHILTAVYDKNNWPIEIFNSNYIILINFTKLNYIILYYH